MTYELIQKWLDSYYEMLHMICKWIYFLNQSHSK